MIFFLIISLLLKKGYRVTGNKCPPNNVEKECKEWNFRQNELSTYETCELFEQIKSLMCITQVEGSGKLCLDIAIYMSIYCTTTPPTTTPTPLTTTIPPLTTTKNPHNQHHHSHHSSHQSSHHISHQSSHHNSNHDSHHHSHHSSHYNSHGGSHHHSHYHGSNHHGLRSTESQIDNNYWWYL